MPFANLPLRRKKLARIRELLAKAPGMEETTIQSVMVNEFGKGIGTDAISRVRKQLGIVRLGLRRWGKAEKRDEQGTV
jgi:hypothetical protein